MSFMPRCVVFHVRSGVDWWSSQRLVQPPLFYKVKFESETDLLVWSSVALEHLFNSSSSTNFTDFIVCCLCSRWATQGTYWLESILCSNEFISVLLNSFRVSDESADFAQQAAVCAAIYSSAYSRKTHKLTATISASTHFRNLHSGLRLTLWVTFLLKLLCTVSLIIVKDF